MVKIRVFCHQMHCVTFKTRQKLLSFLDVSIAREIACFEKRFFPKHAVREHAEAERKHSARGARALSC